mmetsp:Transcript_41711/g.135776  ORF Transcript_41711/g.135776 Transcript_41711/m.135776 type:complete len:242 (+) Transcript_41711:72-797(+)
MQPRGGGGGGGGGLSRVWLDRLCARGGQPLPKFVRLSNHLERVLAAHRLLVEAKLVLRLAVDRLVHAQPLAQRRHKAGQLRLDVVDVIEPRREDVVHIDHDALPVRLAVVNHRKAAEDLDLGDGPRLQNLGPDLDGINRVVVTNVARVGRRVLRVLPRLRERAVVEEHVTEVVVSQLAVLDVLLDRVEHFARGNLELCARELGDLGDEMDGAVVGVQWNVVPRRDLLEVSVVVVEEVHAVL